MIVLIVFQSCHLLDFLMGFCKFWGFHFGFCCTNSWPPRLSQVGSPETIWSQRAGWEFSDRNRWEKNRLFINFFCSNFWKEGYDLVGKKKNIYYIYIYFPFFSTRTGRVKLQSFSVVDLPMIEIWIQRQRHWPLELYWSIRRSPGHPSRSWLSIRYWSGGRMYQDQVEQVWIKSVSNMVLFYTWRWSDST